MREGGGLSRGELWALEVDFFFEALRQFILVLFELSSFEKEIFKLVPNHKE